MVREVYLELVGRMAEVQGTWKSLLTHEWMKKLPPLSVPVECVTAPSAGSL